MAAGENRVLDFVAGSNSEAFRIAASDLQDGFHRPLRPYDALGKTITDNAITGGLSYSLNNELLNICLLYTSDAADECPAV